VRFLELVLVFVSPRWLARFVLSLIVRDFVVLGVPYVHLCRVLGPGLVCRRLCLCSAVVLTVARVEALVARQVLAQLAARPLFARQLVVPVV
jgi:hypothetical protein